MVGAVEYLGEPGRAQPEQLARDAHRHLPRTHHMRRPAITEDFLDRDGIVVADDLLDEIGLGCVR